MVEVVVPPPSPAPIVEEVPQKAEEPAILIVDSVPETKVNLNKNAGFDLIQDKQNTGFDLILDAPLSLPIPVVKPKVDPVFN